ncbi:MAG: hypothetical protein GY796_07710 [Chloroflexi bacterium]|nr:hypothetical protein [Chloroflexota bacterium]
MPQVIPHRPAPTICVIMVGAGQAGITFTIHQYLVTRLSRPGCQANTFAIHQNLVSCLFGSGRPCVGRDGAEIRP